MIKFAVFTDLHYEHIPDGDERINYFISEVKKLKNIDFILQLGDFCYPIKNNHKILDKIYTLGIPFYSVIGNHDSDIYSNNEIKQFLDMKNDYYSFTIGNVKFLILNSCYIKTPQGCVAYSKKNYNKSCNIYPYIPKKQLMWIEKELSSNEKYYVICSHHSLENNFAKRGIANRDNVQSIINKANQNNKKVLLCINGHDHASNIKKIENTYYYGLNSMSYIWVGPKYEHFNYSDKIHKKYPFLKDLVLYKEGLFAIVTIYNNGTFNIKGMEGSYQNISPMDLGIGNTWNGRLVCPKVESLK